MNMGGIMKVPFPDPSIRWQEPSSALRGTLQYYRYHVLKTRHYAPPRKYSVSVWFFWWIWKWCIYHFDLCALSFSVGYPAKSRALQGFGADSFCVILDEVSGHRRGASLLACKKKMGLTPKGETWKGGGRVEGRGGRKCRLFKQGCTIPLCEGRGGGSTPRHLWSTVVFGLPP